MAAAGDGMPVFTDDAARQQALLEQQQRLDAQSQQQQDPPQQPQIPQPLTPEQLQQQQLAEQQRQFVEQEITALYQQLKYDIEDFERHAAYIDNVAVNVISTGEAKHRLTSLLRLDERVTVTSRQLRNYELSNTQRARIGERMDGFYSSSCVSIGKYQELISLRERSMMQQQSHLNPSAASSSHDISVKLPQFVLAEFNGSLDKWLEWRDTFDSVIHRNPKLSKVIKYHYLRNAVKFPAGQLNVLHNFSLDENSYDEAWKALCDRFNDKRKLKSQLFNSLLTVKKMTSDTSAEVRRMLDSFASIVTSMNLLECTFDDLLVHIVQFRLDDQTAKEWQKFIAKQDVSFELMKDFLTEYWSTLDALPSQAKRQIPSKANDKSSPSNAKTFNSTGSSNSSCCSMCKESHLLYQCQKFKLLSVSDRYKFVNDNRLCRNCFSPAHMQRACTSVNRCRFCKQNHHSLLHSEGSKQQVGEAPTASQPQLLNPPNLNPHIPPFQPHPAPRIQYPPRTNFSSFDQHTAVFKSFSTHTEALLSTVQLLVLDANNSWKSCRALMDSGSQSNYMTTSFAKQLGIELIPTSQPVIGINGQTSVIKKRTTAIFSSRYRGFFGDIGCCVSDDITGFLPNHPINMADVKIPTGIFLADPQFNKPGPIDMLLGTGVYHDSQLGNVIKTKDAPVLMETEFGWTVGGNFPVQSPSRSSSLISCFTQLPVSGIEALDAKLDKFIEIESCGEGKKILSPEEQYCVDHFDTTTTQDEFGRTFVKFPFNENIAFLGNNFPNAMRQYFYQEKKRERDPELNELYVDYMAEFISSGHMSEVSESEKYDGHYLPHHGVKKISSTTTKLRPVFNASSKSETGFSLNDCLCVGPTVQPDSFDILLRYREKRYVLKSDLEKMYRQVFIYLSQRKFQKILWRPSPLEPLRHYTLNTVTFGVSSASFLATNSLIYIANIFSDRFPEASRIIKSSFYVDDLVFSFDTIEEGLKLRDQLRFILSSSCFLARKWSANHPDLLEDLHQKDLEMGDEDSPIIKTLGLVWNPTTDVLSFAMKPLSECPTTKAGVLSEIASIYDPIGLIGPVILLAKLHMKPLRTLKWNQELHDDDKKHWQEFRSQLVALNSVAVKRHAIVENPVSIQLHGFADASEEAYGAAIYIRSSDLLGNTQVSLLCSKSRVSPPKQKSIARLELCAAVLLAKLVVKTIEILTVPIEDVTLWSDSMIVLYWIAAESSKLSTFIGNRVSVIQELTALFIWKHIRGLFNPADLISRGLMPDQIQGCLLWWFGPEFLAKSPSEWPESLLTINDDDPELCKEMRKTFAVAQESTLLTLIETRFSSLQKLTNCFAYIRRFAAKNQNRKGPLTVEDLENATLNIVRILQKSMFPVEYEFLERREENPQSKEKFPSKSSILSLSPFMDEHRVVRVGGRVEASPGLSMLQKHQIILPRCHFVKLIVREMHKKFLHPGQRAMLSYVREYYWPLNVKTTIRQVQHECLICFRTKPNFPTQIMGNLPSARVTMAPPFTSTAVDYAGAFNIRCSLTKKSSMTKAYVALFKCMATGAIHLEAVTSLSSDSFITAYDRFISRRGISREIFSDNGTCFVGANNEFKRILKEIEPEIGEFLKEKSIQWHFTTPLAPHAGGIYESGIKSMKHHLVRESASRSFDYEQFSTLLCRIEAIVNSRPLTPLSEDPNDLQVLTPAHFLIGRSLIAKPEKNFIPTNVNRLDRFNQLQKLQQTIWNLWYHDYLHHLQTRPNHFREENEFNVGDMVLLKDANLPSLKWLMGRITKTLPDKKGIVRNVIVKTPTGEKQRHIRYLAFLPFESS